MFVNVVVDVQYGVNVNIYVQVSYLMLLYLKKLYAVKMLMMMAALENFELSVHVMMMVCSPYAQCLMSVVLNPVEDLCFVFQYKKCYY